LSSRARPLIAERAANGVVEHGAEDDVGQSSFQCAHRFHVTGVVRLVDGCLGIGDAVAIWPSGTDLVSDDPLTIKVPGVGEIEVGTTVRGAGGDMEVGGYGGKPSLPQSCSDSPVVTFRSE